jgi:phosphatidylglycerol---prolipoprotein diacylglyceryl transferase
LICVHPWPFFFEQEKMRQVLFRIPGIDWPIYGYGFMLMLAFLVGWQLAERRAKRERVHPDHLWGIAFPVFLGGIIGARLFSRIMEPEPGGFWYQIVSFLQIWHGGLILYGGVPGGLIGYWWAYCKIVKPNKLSTLRIADIVAPSLAIGLFFGRIGCFLNGCCWGDVADPVALPWLQDKPAVTQFPASSPPQRKCVIENYQTAHGFLLGDDGRTVELVEDFSPAWAAGLRAGDVVEKVGDVEGHLFRALAEWPPSEPLRLSISRSGVKHELTFELPRSLPLIPTQLYSSLDGLVLFLLLTAFYPFRKRAGEVTVLLMLAYAVNRFFIEQLRMDNPPDYFGLTLSQTISILMFAGGLALWWYVRKQNVPVTPSAPQG